MKKAVVFSYGRLNPPTKGHEILVNRMLALAKLGNADSILFLSRSHNHDMNPIPSDLKHRIVSKAFPQIKVNSSAASPFIALKTLSEEYEDIVMMVGEDRVEEFRKGMTPYIEQWGIKNFAVMSAGARDPKARGPSGASATKLRTLARQGKEEEFYKGLPDQLNTALKKQVYLLTVKGLKPVTRRKQNARS